MRYLYVMVLAMAVTAAHAADGLIAVKSAHSVGDTADRLEKILRDKGMNVFARIDHSAGASKAGHALRPTQLLIFGNPKVGSPLMLCSQSIAIDLPQKALIWEDAEGVVWFGYNDPQYLAKRHDTGACNGVVSKVGGALANFAAAATKAGD